MEAHTVNYSLSGITDASNGFQVPGRFPRALPRLGWDGMRVAGHQRKLEGCCEGMEVMCRVEWEVLDAQPAV